MHKHGRKLVGDRTVKSRLEGYRLQSFLHCICMEYVGGSSIVKANHFGLTVTPPPPSQKKLEFWLCGAGIGGDVATLSL